jgi:radical SAM superfamily enzyme YgiQ (UPF0313 family)
MPKILLTADQTMMSEYNGSEFLGFAACFPTMISEWVFKKIFCPPMKRGSDGRSVFANCGTRKIEAVLLASGFTEDDVAVVRPQDIDEMIDDDTKVIGITTNDPLGLGPASTTFSSLLGKETFSAYSFKKLVSNPTIWKNNIKLIVGGPGAWQLEDERIRSKMGINTVVLGEGELEAAQVFKKAVDEESLPNFVHGGVVPLEKIPDIRKPTINGLVEIARGCGRGCKFCNPTMQQFRCRSIDNIVKEARVNLDAGTDILLHAEDVLRYRADGPVPNKEAVLELFRECTKLTKGVYISHFALASALSKPDLIEELADVLELGPNYWYTGQTGIETGSPRIASKELAGKALPFSAKDWPQVVKDAHELLNANYWYPCSTLIFGIPGETQDDVRMTRELIEDIKKYKSLIVPLFFVPIGVLDKEKFFGPDDMGPEHWKLFATCMEHDFKWAPRLASESIKCSGMGLLKGMGLKTVIGTMERKTKKYMKLMKEGENPMKYKGDEIV